LAASSANELSDSSWSPNNRDFIILTFTGAAAGTTTRGIPAMNALPLVRPGRRESTADLSGA